MGDFISVNTPLLDGNEKKYVCECIDTGWISSEGSFVKRFEDGLAEYVGRKYGISVANGTAALEVAVKALELEEGSEVILPDFTIISCGAAIVKAGLVPVPIDCDIETWNMDVSQIEEHITSKTSAIMVAHIYGLAVDMDAIMELAGKYHLKVIEDAAEAHGLTYKGRQCGSFGDISIFSFYANKHIACGEGGMIMTDDEKIAQRCMSLRNLCFLKERRFMHEELGENYRMGNLQAAVGLAQLEKLDDTVKKKHYIGKRYRELFKDLKGVRQPLENSIGCENIYWVYGMVLDENWGFDASYVIQKLSQNGVGARPFFYPMHMQPVFRKMGLFHGTVCENSAKIAKYGFYVPSGLGLTEDDIETVAAKVKEILMR